MPDPEFPSSILDLSARVVFFPVRHHSPACARLVRELAHQMRPDAILIEGPSDFNDRIGEMALPHRLPIAIYTYVHLIDGRRRGAFYPFCVYSPEWQALQAAREMGIEGRFIDLPWRAVAADDTPSHRYADGELNAARYTETVCQKLGVETFDDVWDTLAEIEPDLDLAAYMERAHTLCFNIRASGGPPSPVDLRREAFMASQIRQAMEHYAGRLLVVTGGAHSSALMARVFGLDFERDVPQPELLPDETTGEAGIALTPYSYQRLDNLKGYEAGMPNPGFYHQVWMDRMGDVSSPSHTDLTYRTLLARTARKLRERKQTASAADLIAAELTARGLAALRGHAQVWRRDLVDGIIGALVKDEMAYAQTHPFLEAVYDILRGDERGKLAAGTQLPPLVHDIHRQLKEMELEPGAKSREIELDLFQARDLARSRVLHRLTICRIAGFTRMAGSDLAARDDLSRLWEIWKLEWSPEFDAACIEAAIYGGTLGDAAAARLVELAAGIERDAGQAAKLLLEAALMGLDALERKFYDRLVRLIHEEGNWLNVTSALAHLVYLYRYDQALGAAGQADVGRILKEAFERSLWLLEGLGQVQSRDQDVLRGVAAMLDTLERCGGPLGLDRQTLVQVLARTAADAGQTPLLRGAAMGALWTLNEAGPEKLLAGVRYFAAPQALGDYLTGLFHLARETAQSQAGLVLCIDDLLVNYAADEFLEALPALRLAFSYFTPREKSHIAARLMEARGEQPAALPDLEVNVEIAAQVMAFEARLFQAAEKYGIRCTGEKHG